MIAAPVLLSAALLGAPPAVPLAPPAQVEILPDGTELVVAPISGARMVSFRYLVHAGSSRDPVMMDGLAHLIEHLIFRGGYTIDQRSLFDLVKARGGDLNGFTTTTHTTYVLDGVRGSDLDVVLPPYLGAITGPVFLDPDINVEKEVVASEAMLRPSYAIFSVTSLLLLSGAYANQGVIGTVASRNRINRDDLLRFYEEQYRPSNTTVILTGNIDLDRARRLVVGSSLLPPDDPPAPRDAVERVELSTPVDVALRTYGYLTVYGYDLDDTPVDVCQALAELVDLRLNLAVNVEDPIASSTGGHCWQLRGHRLLLGVASSFSYDGSGLPAKMGAVFDAVRMRPMTPPERAHLLRRGQHRRARRLGDPAQLADALVEAFSVDRPGADRAPIVHQVFDAPPLDAAAMRRAAEKMFTAPRRIVIYASPF